MDDTTIRIQDESEDSLYAFDNVLEDLEIVSDMMVQDVDNERYDRLLQFESARQILIDRMMENSTDEPTASHFARLQNILQKSQHAIDIVHREMRNIQSAYQMANQNMRKSSRYIN